jgi:hypothetical protein
MGLFSRKKKNVPPPPQEGLLNFPKQPTVEKEILPDNIKQAAGVDKQEDIVPPLPEEPIQTEPAPLPQPDVPEGYVLQKPYFARITQYKKLVENLDCIKVEINGMDEITTSLEKSEYNENKDFEKLKSNLKKIHDRLLFVDDLIFKR